MLEWDVATRPHNLVFWSSYIRSHLLSFPEWQNNWNIGIYRDVERPERMKLGEHTDDPIGEEKGKKDEGGGVKEKRLLFLSLKKAEGCCCVHTKEVEDQMSACVVRLYHNYQNHNNFFLFYLT